MSIFTINNSVAFNSQNSNAFYNEFKNLVNSGITSNPNNIYVKYNQNIYDQNNIAYTFEDSKKHFININNSFNYSNVIYDSQLDTI
jgi:hypothetical protein